MTIRTKRNLARVLVRSMKEAVAIESGRLRPARRRRRTVSDVAVMAPPKYRATRIRALREGLGLSQPVFAKALNVSVATVRGWEQATRVPDGPSRRLLELAERHPKVILGAVRDSRGRTVRSPAA